MATHQVIDYLNQKQAQYELTSHPPAYTAQEVAAAAHISGKLLAKTVVVAIDGALAFVVVPADRDVDLCALQLLTHAKHVAIAEPHQFAGKFQGCQRGTMPPFGDLYAVPVFFDEELTKHVWITFNSGSRTDLVTMKVPHYLEIAKPTIAAISEDLNPQPGTFGLKPLRAV